MTTYYRCDHCGEEFRNARECRTHESSHYDGAEKIKYNLMYSSEECICDYCEHSFYVYGCEQDCSYEDCRFLNNYKDFIPVEPFHNKRNNGGI